MKHSIFLLFVLAICSCSPKNKAEAVGEQMLNDARARLNEKNYDAARDSILSLRKNYPTALKSRAAAILLLDSIEMIAAKDSAQYAEDEELERLQIKAQFFQRKLIEDQAQKQ